MTSNCSDILRLKVGHILNKPVGFVSAVQIQGKEFHIASDLLVDIFGDQGRHARVAVGSNALPLGIAVEIDAIVQLK